MADIDARLAEDAAAAAEEEEAADEAAEHAVSLAISSPPFEMMKLLYAQTAE